LKVVGQLNGLTFKNNTFDGMTNAIRENDGSRQLFASFGKWHGTFGMNATTTFIEPTLLLKIANSNKTSVTNFYKVFKAYRELFATLPTKHFNLC
jgi:hypothetical protein